MIEITNEQYHIMLHALCAGQPIKGFYRNHYCVDEGAQGFEVCEELVSLGFMAKHTREWVPGNIFLVTDAGRAFMAAKVIDQLADQLRRTKEEARRLDDALEDVLDSWKTGESPETEGREVYENARAALALAKGEA